MKLRAPLPLMASLLLVGAVTGCRLGDNGREPWRTEAEEQCLAEKGVVPSAFMERLPAIEGKGACGMEYPFRVHAFADGNVTVEPAARMACPAIRESDKWVREVVQPAAMAWLGQPIVAIRQMSSYSCRTMNGQAGTKISEHAFGNALDVGAFRTADGRWIVVKTHWTKGTPEEQGFLRQVHAGACETFTTVLAPGSNIYHYDHIHFDLKRHAKGRTYCNPKLQNLATPPQPGMAGGMPVKAAIVPAAPDLPPDMPPYQPPAYDPPVYKAPQAGSVPQGTDNDLPPGWTMGPDGYPVAGPMSYSQSIRKSVNGSPAALSSGRGAGPFGADGALISQRRYYIAPVPQPSPIPLPTAQPGED